MTDEGVTHVTRNQRALPPEVKLVIDLLASAGMLYYVTHPDMFDDLGATVRVYWGKLTHRVSIWSARQEIRTLPETDK